VQLKRGGWLCGVLVLCGVASPQRAAADDAPGTWSGSLEGRGNYFWERSTRVVVPEAKVALTAPNGIRMHAEYLVDVISSASIGQGVSADGVLTELRHGVGAGVGKELDLTDTQLDLAVHGTYSTENDYTSFMYGLDTALSLDQRTTKLTLGLTRVDDDIEANNDPTFSGKLHGTTVALGLERVVNESIVLSVGYQLAYLEGFLGNPYRRVVHEQGAPLREAPPDTRLRHNATARAAFALSATHSALHLLYRAYIDSWDVAALTPEVRFYQQIGAALRARLRYRFYTQTRASFAEEDGRYPMSATTYVGPTTNDPKLLALHTHTFGLMLEYDMTFLANTVLDFASSAVLDIGVDRYLSSSSFGNGVVGSVGGRLPF